MKRIISIIFLGSMFLFLQSCTKTCTCIDANNKVQELEVDPAENCSDRSGDLLGICY